jgi:sulfatase modifying factor 1
MQSIKYIVAGAAIVTGSFFAFFNIERSLEFVWVPEGHFSMGAQSSLFADALPVHDVFVDGFWLSNTEITNSQFEVFVNATGYITLAERPLSKELYPQLSEEERLAGGMVFSPPPTQNDVNLNNSTSWWSFVVGANWRHPEGPSSSIEGMDDHPVVQIAYEDALAYAAWSRTRLPTEAEWEKAARGGLERKKYVWGDELKPEDKYVANIFQGMFPTQNSIEDGFEKTSPVKQFPPNLYGVFGMAGNVWEWTQDGYDPHIYKKRERTNTFNPLEKAALDFAAFNVIRGGSFACASTFCARYMPGAREKATRDTSSNHIGFRVVKEK